MFELFRTWRRSRILMRRPIADALWQRVIDATPSLHALRADEQARLRELATLFAAEKTLVGTHGLVVNDYMRVAIAAQACLPILNLGLDYYRNWLTVVMYPGPFVAQRCEEDEDGIVHTGYEELDGESMAGGPMALSWQEADPESAEPGANVVLHECAHKLDELTGDANGLPPLHRDMRIGEWTTAFEDAFDRFAVAAEGTEALAFDDYAATDPAEFFAVMTEAFFDTPHALLTEYPRVYGQLAAFYRQDPAARET